jgi:hypothetical protein
MVATPAESKRHSGWVKMGEGWKRSSFMGVVGIEGKG